MIGELSVHAIKALDVRLVRDIDIAVSQTKGKNRIAFHFLLALIPLALLLAFWYWSLAWGPPYIRQFLPRPGDTALRFFELLWSGALLTNVASSIARVLLGVGFAILVGVPLGVLMGSSKTMERIFDPTFEFLRPIPIAAWVPLSIMLFGIGELPALTLIFLGALYPIVLNARDGVRYVDPIHVQAAHMLGAKPWEVVLRVVLPSALPSIITGIRQALGIGWWVVILAELLAVRSGVGYMMVVAQQMWEPDVIICGMIAIGLVGLLMNRLTGRLERLALHWRA